MLVFVFLTSRWWIASADGKASMVRDLLIEVMPLIGSHFSGIEPDGPPRRVARRYYPLARDIMIPFEAPLEYSIGGQVYFPWFSFCGESSSWINRFAFVHCRRGGPAPRSGSG